MGGSGNGYDGGAVIDPIGDDCGVRIFFNILIMQEDYEAVWEECNIGDDIAVHLEQNGLPKLIIRRTSDAMKIGLIPPKYSKLIKCIINGWNYTGKVIEKTGSNLNPQIRVEIWGEE